MDNLQQIINTTNQEYFQTTLKKFGATQEQIQQLTQLFPSLINDAIRLKLDDKLNILHVFGFEMQDILDRPHIIFKPTTSIILKCEIALLEGVNPNPRLLDKTKHRDLVSNYSARKKGYLPYNSNIFYDSEYLAHHIKMSRSKFINKFYKGKNIRLVHQDFMKTFPDFYEELKTIDEYHFRVSQTFSNQSTLNYSTLKTISQPKTKFTTIQPNVCYSTERYKKYSSLNEEKENI